MRIKEKGVSSTPPSPESNLKRVLVVDPHPTLRTVLAQRLRQDGHLTAAVSTASEAITLCEDLTPDLLVAAELLEETSALKLAGQLRCPCLLYTSPSPRDKRQSRMPSSA